MARPIVSRMMYRGVSSSTCSVVASLQSSHECYPSSPRLPVTPFLLCPKAIFLFFSSLLFLEEIVRHPPRHQRLSRTRRRVELEESVLEVLVDLHDGGLVAAAVAVVGGREDCDDLRAKKSKGQHSLSCPHRRLLARRTHISLLTPIEPIHDQLMCPRHQCQPIVMVKRLRDVLPERVACTTRADTPSTAVVWVRPEEVTHGTLVRHLLDTVDGADVVQSVDGGGETAVQAKDLFAGGG